MSSLFVSCAWQQGTPAFRRCCELNEELVENGVRTHFEQHRVQGDADHALENAIDASDLVLVLLSRAYIEELDSPSTSADTRAHLSWCRREWTYTRRSKDAGGVLIAAMEPELLTPEFRPALSALLDALRDPHAPPRAADDNPADEVLDFSVDYDVDEVLEAWQRRCQAVTAGRVRRAARAQSMLEGPTDWRDQQRELFYPNGDLKYRGTLLFNRMHGQGTYFFPNGDRYEGSFADDYFDGEGRLLFRDGSKYVGQFRFDKRSGIGKKFRPDGSLAFEGEYESGLRNGHGTEYDTEERPVLEGLWEAGDLKQVLAEAEQLQQSGGNRNSKKKKALRRVGEHSGMSLLSDGSAERSRGSTSSSAEPSVRRASLAQRVVRHVSEARRRSRRVSKGKKGGPDDDDDDDGDDAALDEAQAEGRASVSEKKKQNKKKGSSVTRLRVGKFKVDP